MAMSYYNISLYHFADHLIYLPSSSSFWFSLNSSYEHDFQLLLELTLSESLTLDKEVRMQEEWHCNERKCTLSYSRVISSSLILISVTTTSLALPLHRRCTFRRRCVDRRLPLPLRCPSHSVTVGSPLRCRLPSPSPRPLLMQHGLPLPNVGEGNGLEYNLVIEVY